jgi:hypothetical protein
MPAIPLPPRAFGLGLGLGAGGAKDRVLAGYVRELGHVFGRDLTKREAHARSAAILADMAADKSVLGRVLAEHFASPSALNALHFPTLTIPIARTADFELAANCFFPSPRGETDVTTGAIHHHGPRLLTTATVFGPGYEHWRFQKPELVDARADLLSIGLLDRKALTFGSVAFVDAFMPHAIMLPRSLAITFVLSSGEHPRTWKDHARLTPIPRAQKERIKRVLPLVGLGRLVGLRGARANTAAGAGDYVDFHPTPQGFRGMREPIRFQPSSNADYLHALFHVVQATGNAALARLALAHVDGPRAARVTEPDRVKRLAGDVLSGRPVPLRHAILHEPMDHMNFKASAILERLSAERVSAAARRSTSSSSSTHSAPL